MTRKGIFVSRMRENARGKKTGELFGVARSPASLKTFVTCDICLDITYITACLNIRQKGIITWQARLTSKKNKKKSTVNGSASSARSCMIQKICSG